MPSPTEIEYLRSKEQRYRLYFVKWDSYQIRQTFPLLSDASVDPPTLKYLGTKTEDDFETIVNIGSNRLAFVDEPIEFDCSRSFRIHNGSITGPPFWEWEDSGSGGTSTDTELSISWDTPGLYKITCTYDGGIAERYVRVLQDRQASAYDVIALSGVSSGLSGGAQSQITIAPQDNLGQDSLPVSIGDFQAVGIFIEEEWFSGSHWHNHPIGGFSDPTLLLSGYVDTSSVSIDANTHNVSFTISSIADMMGKVNVFGTQTWNKDYLDADQNLTAPALPNPPQGVVLDLSANMVMPDVITYWLQKYTNVLKRHDFSTWWDNSQKELDTISTNEGDLWSAFSGLASNEFAWFFADAGGGIHFEPNPMIRSTGWFEDTYDIPYEITDVDLLNVQVQVKKMREVIWVQIIGTRVRDGKQWTARYPSDTPKSGVGQWQTIQGISVSRQSFLDSIVDNIYKDANRKISATLTMPLNRAFTVPDRITVTLIDPDKNVNWNAKEFYIQQISYSMNPADATWQTSLSIIETIPTHTLEFGGSGYVVV